MICGHSVMANPKRLILNSATEQKDCCLLSSGEDEAYKVRKGSRTLKIYSGHYLCMKSFQDRT